VSLIAFNSLLPPCQCFSKKNCQIEEQNLETSLGEEVINVSLQQQFSSDAKNKKNALILRQIQTVHVLKKLTSLVSGGCHHCHPVILFYTPDFTVKFRIISEDLTSALVTGGFTREVGKAIVANWHRSQASLTGCCSMIGDRTTI